MAEVPELTITVDQLDEYTVRQFFKKAPLDVVRDLLSAGRAIVEMREEAPKKRIRKPKEKPAVDPQQASILDGAE